MSPTLLAKWAAIWQSRRTWIVVVSLLLLFWGTPNVVLAELVHAGAIIVAAWIISDGLRSTGLRAVVLACLASSSLPAIDLHDVCREATVRIRNGTVVGTGTVFKRTDHAIYVLTNAHVCGTQLNQLVTAEFWRDGHQSRPIAGQVVAVAYQAGAYRDVGVVRILQTDLGNYQPPVVPLADPSAAANYSYVYTVGCPAGRWPSSLEGFALYVGSDDGHGEIVRFVPAPAGGRSGSALFDLAGWYPRIVGLVGWRSSSEGGHNLDGFGEKSGHGIAMTHREVWGALKDRPSNLIRGQWAVPPNALPIAHDTGKDPATGGAGDETVIGDNWHTGTGRDSVLLYSDPFAVQPDTYPIQYDGAAGGQCPPGGCPPGQGQQQPWGLPGGGGDQLFPSWRAPSGEPQQWLGRRQDPETNWVAIAPWVALAALSLVVVYLLAQQHRPRHDGPLPIYPSPPPTASRPPTTPTA